MKDIRFALLVEGWLHDELDEPTSRRLLALVRADPQRRAFLGDQARLHTMLAAQHADTAAGEELLQRVRAGVQRPARACTARRRMAWTAGLLAAAALVSLGLWLITGPEAAGPVLLWRDGRGLALDQVGPWRLGDELRARAAGSVSLPDGSRVALAAGSRLAWRSEAGGVALDLRAGTARFDVRTRREPDFRVATSHVACRVLGTQFTLRTVANATLLSVHEGRVQVEGDGGVLAAGERRWFFDDPTIDAWLAGLPRHTEALATLSTRARPLQAVATRWRPQGSLRLTRDPDGRPVLAAAAAATAVYALPPRSAGDFVVRVATTVVEDRASSSSLRLSVRGLSFRIREQTATPRIAGTTVQELRFRYRGRHHLTDWWEYEQRIDGVVALRGFAYGRPEAIALHLEQITVRVDEVVVAVGE